MAKLTSKQRDALPTSDFAGPDRSYPVQDKAHAVAAKARATQFAPPALKAAVDAKADAVIDKPAYAGPTKFDRTGRSNPRMQHPAHKQRKP